MTILSQYQRLKTEQKIEEEKKLFNVKKQQYDNLQKQNKTQSSRIPNMSEQLKKVRENKTTLNRDYCRLTSSGLNV
jgi:hypothetical protein